MKYSVYSQAGPIAFGDYDLLTGAQAMAFITRLRQIGCANSTLTITPSAEFNQVLDTCTGSAMPLANLPAGKGISISLVMRHVSAREIAMAYFGDAIVSAAGTVTAEVLPALEAGDMFFLRNPFAKSVVVQDSTTGTALQYLAGTHYRQVGDPEHATFQLIAHPNSHVEPVVVDYEYDESVSIPTMTLGVVETSLVYLGRNYDGSKSRIMIPVVSWAMSGDFAWITEPGTAAELSFTGTVMMAQGLNDPSFGDFMKIDALPN